MCFGLDCHCFHRTFGVCQIEVKSVRFDLSRFVRTLTRCQVAETSTTGAHTSAHIDGQLESLCCESYLKAGISQYNRTTDTGAEGVDSGSV